MMNAGSTVQRTGTNLLLPAARMADYQWIEKKQILLQLLPEKTGYVSGSFRREHLSR